MRRLIFIYALLFLLFGCESEKVKIEKSNQAVKSLISNLSVNNWAGAYEYYPNLKKLGTRTELTLIESQYILLVAFSKSLYICGTALKSEVLK